MQNQREGKDLAESDKVTEGNTLNQGDPSPWELHATNSKEKMEGSWKGAPISMEDGGLRDVQEKRGKS